MTETFDYYTASLVVSLLTAYQATWWWAAGLTGFVVLPGIDAGRREKLFQAVLFLLLSLPGAGALALHFLLPHVIAWYRHARFESGPLNLQVMFIELAAGLVAGWIYLRHGAQAVDRLKAKATIKSSQERNRRTDVRDIKKMLPAERATYDPRKYYNEKKGMFLGLNEHGKPLYLPYSDWLISNALLSGRPRSGKGVAAQISISQAIRRHEFAVILDPKVDNWMPHIFYAEAKSARTHYAFLDLRQPAPPQVNLFEDADEETIENMLIGAFGLSEKGEGADFYRLADRAAARGCARWLAQSPGSTAADAVAALGAEWLERAPAFHAYMLEMAEIPAVNRRAGGIRISAMEQSGGCLYAVGDMVNPRIIRLQKMLLLRLLFLAKNRDYLTKTPRPITVFADEFKVHISRPFMTALGAAAGWGLHVILAFQSFQDLADCPSDLDKDVVRGAVLENCAVQLSYAIKDAETAEVLAASTGTILVDDESRKVEKNLVLSEIVDGDRTLRQAERYLIDVNMFINLPRGCGVVNIPGQLAQFCFTSPIPALRTQAAITPTHAELTVPAGAPSRSLAEQSIALDD